MQHEPLVPPTSKAGLIGPIAYDNLNELHLYYYLYNNTYNDWYIGKIIEYDNNSFKLEYTCPEEIRGNTQIYYKENFQLPYINKFYKPADLPYKTLKKHNTAKNKNRPRSIIPSRKRISKMNKNQKAKSKTKTKTNIKAKLS